jgi:hypothetical protein
MHQNILSEGLHQALVLGLWLHFLELVFGMNQKMFQWSNLDILSGFDFHNIS